MVAVDLLRPLGLFKFSSDEFLKALAGIAIVRTITNESLILKQGQINDRLLILLKGKVEVSVDGERVALLETPGDLLGEISVLVGRPVIASITALSDVEFLEASTKDIEATIQSSPSSFGYPLYRLLSSVLSEKIINTNQKARQFEIANRALVDSNRNLDQKVQERTQQLKATNLELETQNIELLASHRKIEELYATKELTFRRLTELLAALDPLQSALGTLKAQSAPENGSNGPIHEATSRLATSLEMLKPITELYSSEQAMRSRKVLIVEPDRKQQVLSRMALGGTGVQLGIAGTKEEACALIQAEGRFDLIFVSSEIASVIPELRSRLPEARIVYVTSSDMRAELPSLELNMPSLSNIISRNLDDRVFTVKNITTTISKLLSKDLFGLEKYMNWGVDVQKRPVRHSKDRDGLIASMQEHMKGLGVRSLITDRAATVTEELLMNAIYDAPIGADGTPLHAHLARTNEVSLNPRECAEFRFACDGVLAAVSVSDPFGTFKLSVLMNYLKKNYSGADSVQEAGKGGAGRGLHQIVENSDLVVFNVHKNYRTEVIAFFNLDPKSKSQASNPTFHFFSE
ncbi:MAG: cyclic nucleotide-binding domain-containing protein [Bdellovibrionota bacterium]